MTTRRNSLLLSGLVALWAIPCWGQAIHSIINSFNSGELTPRLEGRTDISKYYSGCKTLENMVVLPYGGVTKRPGTYYIAAAKSSSAACRLIPFEYSVANSYVLEFGNGYIRFFKDGAQVLDSNSVPYEISSPFATADLAGLKFVQSYDVMYIASPAHQTQKLTRAGPTTWTIADVAWDWGPFLTENTTSTKLTPSATSGTITVTADANIFDPNHVGSQWQLSYVVPAASVSANFTTHDVNTAKIIVYKEQKYDFSSHGNWTGTATLQRSYDSGSTWEDVRPCHYEDDGNLQYTGQELVNDAYYRVYMTVYTSGTCNVSLVRRASEVPGVVSITNYVSPAEVNAVVLHMLGGTSATTSWSEGAWSTYRGYPSCVTFFEQRLCLAGTTHQPQTVWISQTPMTPGEGWECMRSGALESDSFSYTIGASQGNAIQWTIGHDQLLIGTSDAEWKMSSGSTGEPVSATNVVCTRQTTYGSAPIQAVLVDHAVLFVQRHATKVREFLFSSQVETYQAADLSVLSEHVTRPGITQIAYQRVPDSILWTIVDGNVAGLTYQRDNEVLGWHRHDFGGQVESICVIPGTGEEDELWLEVARPIGGSTVRCIEQVQPTDWGDEQADAFFVDCGLSSKYAAAVAITAISKASPGVVTCPGHAFLDGQQVRIWGVAGMTNVNDGVFTVHAPTSTQIQLRDKTDAFNWDTSSFPAYTSGGYIRRVENAFTVAHLAGETVAIVGDGSYVGTATAGAGGAVTCASYYSNVHIGLPYTAKVQPMRLEARSRAGTAQGVTKRVLAITCRLYRSLSLSVGPTWTKTYPLVFRKTTDTASAVTPLFTGDKRIEFGGDYDTDAYVCLISTAPMPLTILAIMPEWEIYQ